MIGFSFNMVITTVAAVTVVRNGGMSSNKTACKPWVFRIPDQTPPGIPLRLRCKLNRTPSLLCQTESEMLPCLPICILGLCNTCLISCAARQQWTHELCSSHISNKKGFVHIVCTLNAQTRTVWTNAHFSLNVVRWKTYSILLLQLCVDATVSGHSSWLCPFSGSK